MKKTFLFVMFNVAITALLFITGCDTESASTNNVSISPSSASMQEGESVTFTASGGYTYSWSLSEPEWGVLSTTDGNTTTYTSIYSPETNATAYQVLTLTSTIEGSSTTSDSSTSTNSTSSYGMTAEVYIEHYTPTEEGEDTNETAEISISPTSTSLAQWSSQEFTASGGSESYTWSLATSDYGVLSSSSGSTISYTATYEVTNTLIQTITVTDSDGSSTSATVTQTE